jgi:beta-glucosidase
MSKLTFPRDFAWGTATSAYQIEGAANEGGRGESIWDRFAHTNGKITTGEHGDVACDHYHRYADDIRLMREIGVNAYRFSISWSRVLPHGSGGVNKTGLDFYARVVDALLEAEITPFATLFHWDLPQALQVRGGFESRDIAGWFGDYAHLIATKLGDRLKHFITLNEPQVFALYGHITGEHAPGRTDFSAYARVAHHLGLAHGRGVEAIRAGCRDAQVGTTLQLVPMHPLNDSEADHAAAQRMDGFFNRFYLDSVLRGVYPEDTLALLQPLGIPIEEGDMRVIAQPLDFVGLNNYTRVFVRAVPELPGLGAVVAEDHRVRGASYTTMGWEVYPRGLYEWLTRLQREYDNPVVYVTENGGAFPDELTHAGRVHDDDRVDLLRGYIAAMHDAMQEGAKVRGYFVWSLLDNFEWTFGYAKRFGLVHVDFATQKRTLKDSARFYREVIASGLR